MKAPQFEKSCMISLLWVSKTKGPKPDRTQKKQRKDMFKKPKNGVKENKGVGNRNTYAGRRPCRTQGRGLGHSREKQLKGETTAEPCWPPEKKKKPRARTKTKKKGDGGGIGGKKKKILNGSTKKKEGDDTGEEWKNSSRKKSTKRRRNADNGEKLVTRLIQAKERNEGEKTP